MDLRVESEQNNVGANGGAEQSHIAGAWHLNLDNMWTHNASYYTRLMHDDRVQQCKCYQIQSVD